MSKNTMRDGTATASRPGTGNTPAPAALRKSLKNRHVQLIALGGATRGPVRSATTRPATGRSAPAS